MRSNARILVIAFALAGCGGTRPSVGATLPISGAYGQYQETGLASWYGEELSGNRTASGEMFDAGAITAAHRTLPLGSFVEVTSVETGRSILVRINDRGPGRRDRIIDLSRGAARMLGTDRRPVAAVRVRAIMPTRQDAATLRAGHAVAARDPRFTQAVAALPRSAQLPTLRPGHSYGLQVATFSNEARARALAERLDARILGGGGLWRVRLGPYDDPQSLQRARDAVAARGYGDAQVLVED
ncbi:septal ring lytic transglycosylase RlpA family protein [Sphingomonas sp. PB2P19]|uniref:septal ring lytic transglycosylase RlpA family protein n=1 Tax=Sphingomonas rhamnosi TaxID=3096156 RepID=UPI002FCA3CF4